MWKPFLPELKEREAPEWEVCLWHCLSLSCAAAGTLWPSCKPPAAPNAVFIFSGSSDHMLFLACKICIFKEKKNHIKASFYFTANCILIWFSWSLSSHFSFFLSVIILVQVFLGHRQRFYTANGCIYRWLVWVSFFLQPPLPPLLLSCCSDSFSVDREVEDCCCLPFLGCTLSLGLIIHCLPSQQFCWFRNLL